MDAGEPSRQGRLVVTVVLPSGFQGDGFAQMPLFAGGASAFHTDKPRILDELTILFKIFFDLILQFAEMFFFVAHAASYFLNFQNSSTPSMEKTDKKRMIQNA